MLNKRKKYYNKRKALNSQEQLKIEKGTLSDLNELFQIYSNAKNNIERNGIYQWTNNYPTRSIIESDLKKATLQHVYLAAGVPRSSCTSQQSCD